MEIDLAIKLTQHDTNVFDAELSCNGKVNTILNMTTNTYNPGDTSRTIVAQLFEIGQHPGGRKTANTGWFIRGYEEKTIKLILQDNSGNELGVTETAYPH
ncbi:MAG: hypothetical protein H6581_00900 [Bacteroidia bacterium]|nr:hypothetical protein [Bacteroidia bacterium]